MSAPSAATLASSSVGYHYARPGAALFPAVNGYAHVFGTDIDLGHPVSAKRTISH